MRIVVTGGDGFIGRNLQVRLLELGYDNVLSVNRDTITESLYATLEVADFVFHLAGINRPRDSAEFDVGNRQFTETVCDMLVRTGKRTPLVFTSSTQALLDNPYGRSKRAAEAVIERYARVAGAPVYLFRLTNVFGKWSRPNYNSVVATFCHNIIKGTPIAITDPAAPLKLVYIDDVIDAMADILQNGREAGDVDISPLYETTVGEVAEILHQFASSRETGIIPQVGTGLRRALYGTWASHLTPELFTYPLIRHEDRRGVFAEVLKTTDSGQISFFTAHPGITRGGHYHHTKTEKFLVVKGRARFGFRHILTGNTEEIFVTSDDLRVVETVPGWAHDVTNVGNEEMIVMLWANEIFDTEKPDTFATDVLQ
jgi:UDP-2-acetamido-2,6-beta-L-arabino-hexul-4-ose reductase